MDPEDFFIKEWKTSVTLPDGTVVDGIFDRLPADVGVGVGIAASNPQVALLSTVAAVLGEGDRLIVKSRDTGVDEVYRVVCPGVDDEGLAMVDLEDWE
ncbi:hypothetical protein [Pontiella sp.]|uniref:hypothetical protein n=1 Tax=Pontiella sp. TaxID=2837462 RepID=UPI0035632E83